MAEETGGGGILSTLLGNANVEQIFMWTVLSQIMGAVAAPALALIQQAMFAAEPDAVLSPAELASAVVRGFLPKDTAALGARYSGVDGGRFDTLVRLAGAALSPQALAEALRRGIIPYDSGDPDKPGFLQGVYQGSLRDMWAPVLQALALALPSPSDALNALLEGQTDEATAKDLYKKFGGDPQYFQLMYDTAGSAPTPNEAAVMANRGIIPWTGTGPDATTFEQAFLEGPWRNKWLGPYQKMSQYYPPPRTVTAMVREGSLTDEQGLALLKEQGLSDTLAGAYIVSAHTTATAKTKELAESTVVKLYTDQLVTSDDASKMLTAIGYSAKDAGFILAVADLQTTEANLRNAVSRIRSLFVGHKINVTTATNALNSLQVPSDQVQNIIGIWQLEASANVKIPSESQIVDAYKYSIIDQTTATSLLGELGYAPHDAWLLLSIRMHAPQPNEPALTAIGGG